MDIDKAELGAARNECDYWRERCIAAEMAQEESGMTKKERIAKLERELADVKRRLDVLEGRRIVFPSEPQIAPYEPCYVQPTKLPYRDTTGDRWWERQPQTGDPLPPITITVSGAV